MNPTELLTRTANLMENRPYDRLNIEERMEMVIEPTVRLMDPALRDDYKHQRKLEAAQLMADAVPPELADLPALNYGIELLDLAHSRLVRQHGQPESARQTARWMRAAASVQPA